MSAIIRVSATMVIIGVGLWLLAATVGAVAEERTGTPDLPGLKRGADVTILLAAAGGEANAAAMDLVADLKYFLGILGIAEGLDTYDRNGIAFDKGGKPMQVANGLPDAAELALLEGILKDPTLDYASTGGVVYEYFWRVWESNLEEANAALPDGLDPRINDRVRRVVAAYMTLGDRWSGTLVQEQVKTLCPAAKIDLDRFDRSRGRYLLPKSDADNDGVLNIREFQAADGDRATFVRYALDQQLPPK